MSAEQEIVYFLYRHFGEQLPPGEYVELRWLAASKEQPAPRPNQEWHRNLDRLAQRALQLAPAWNVYFGVNTRRYGGGKKVDVRRLYALHADVDWGLGKPFDNDVVAFNAIVALRPHVDAILLTGGGFHCWWHLADRPLATPETVAAAEATMRGLYHRLNGSDPVQNVDRILRLPATKNHKYAPGAATRVVFDMVRERGWSAPSTLADFGHFHAADPPPAGARPRPAGGAAAWDRGTAPPAIEEVRELLRHIPPVGAYLPDWLTVLAAVHSIFPDETGIALCEGWSPGYAGEITEKFRSFGRYGGRLATVGTLYRMAKLGGWRPSPAARLRRSAREVGYGRV